MFQSSVHFPDNTVQVYCDAVVPICDKKLVPFCFPMFLSNSSDYFSHTDVGRKFVPTCGTVRA